MYYGYNGFVSVVSDHSTISLLRDQEILAPGITNNHNYSKHEFTCSDLYNDISNRMGQKCREYVEVLEKKKFELLNTDIGIQARQWISKRITPFLCKEDLPERFCPIVRQIQDIDNEFGMPVVKDRLCMPLTASDGRMFFLALSTSREVNSGEIASGITLAHAYHRICMSRSRGPNIPTGNQWVALGTTQLECIRWAVAGKTASEISTLTKLTVHTVRYHLAQARIRYGYATIQQTLVRAARDYNLDPLGPYSDR